MPLLPVLAAVDSSMEYFSTVVAMSVHAYADKAR